LAISVLPVPVGADEEKDAERARRVGELRLGQRDPVDEAVDGFALAEDTRREEGPHLVEVERHLRVDDVKRQARGLGQRRQDMLRADG
jgi:hypothetical protein